jgi:TonB family protein
MRNKIKILRGLISIIGIIYPVLAFNQDISQIKYVPPTIDLINDDSITLPETEDGNRILASDSGFYIDDTELFVNFPGGEEALRKFIKKNLYYPDSAVKAGIDGKVIISFNVSENGKLTDIRIIKGISSDINQEVIKLVRDMPDWVWDRRIEPNERKQVKKCLQIIFKL